MKKKNLTINRLALGNLKARKKQYTIMIIGILLAMIFSSGVLFLISCMQSSGEEIARQKRGNAFGIFYDSDGIINPEGDFEKQYISEYGYAHIIGYGYADEEKKSRGTSIAYLDEEARDLYYVTLEEGREPERKGEIAVESTTLAMLGKNKAKIGDKITLSVQTPNGDDFTENTEQKTYTLVGILADKKSNIQKFYEGSPGSVTRKIPAAFVHKSEKMMSGGKEIKVLYYNVYEDKLKKTVTVEVEGGFHYEASLYEAEFKLPLQDKYGTRSIEHVKSISGYTDAAASEGNIRLYIVLSCVLMLASCIGIINSFSANLQERKKQIGMLRAVGATRRQIINIFGREAFIITFVCAPVSVAISYFGVKLFAYLMGDKFIFIPNFLVLLVTTAVSVVCVMLASLIPLFVSSRITPMQAIRNIELSRKMKNKKIKSQSAFDAPKLLAKRSLALHRGKQIGVSIILSVTVLLSCFGFSFIEGEKERAESLMADCDYSLESIGTEWIRDEINFPNFEVGFTENDKRDIENHYLISEAYSFKEYYTFLNVAEYSPYMDIIDGEFRYGGGRMDFPEGVEINTENFVGIWYTDKGYDFYNDFKSKAGFEDEIFKTQFTLYDSNIIEKYKNNFEIIDGAINIDKLNSGEEVILVAPEEIGHLVCEADGKIIQDGIQDMSKPVVDHNYNYNYKNRITHSAKLDYKAGDTLHLSTLYSEDVVEFTKFDDKLISGAARRDREVKIGAIVKPFDFSSSLYIRAYQALTVLSTVPAEPILTGTCMPYKKIAINTDSEIDDENDAEITQFLNTYGQDTDSIVFSQYAIRKESEENLKSLLIAMISIIILLFSTGAAIINNTLTAKIRESKREIGTLRAVGASARELTLSYILQMISMFFWGSVAGFGLYSIAHVVLKLILKEDWIYPFTIGHGLVAIALLIVICSINLYSKVKKEMKNSIVENIREL